MAYEHTLRTVTLESPHRFLAPAAEMLKTWSERARSRRQLSLRLDDHILNDIGLSQAEAIQEVSKYFWQA